MPRGLWWKVGLGVLAGLATLFTDAMLWDTTSSLIVFGLWGLAGAVWLAAVARARADRLKAAAWCGLALLVPPAAAVGVAGTDWAPRAAVSVSRAQLDRLADAAPRENTRTDRWAGLYRVTWTSKTDAGVYLAIDPLGGGVDDFLATGCGLARAEGVQLDRLKDDEDGPPSSLIHLSGPWYAVCYTED